MASKSITSTKNYRLFKRSGDNRPLDVAKHKKLEQSMKKYGFLSCFPIVCHRNGDKHLIVKDGQHRLTIAETLSLPVSYVVETVDFDIAQINSTPKTWQLVDYALTHSANGKTAYATGLEFAQQHGIPLNSAFAMLGGCSNFSNLKRTFIDGTFKIKDRVYADLVASLYAPLVRMAPAMKREACLDACMVVCRVEGFDAKRLLGGADRCRERLVPYSNKDAYLTLFEELYNFGRSKLFGLKSAAQMSMRQRNPATAKASKNGKHEKATA